MIQDKPKQHYVWQRYLKNWAHGDTVFCRHEQDRVFPVNTSKIAAQRYFYRFEPPSKQALLFISEVVRTATHEAIRAINFECIETFLAPFLLIDKARKNGLDEITAGEMREHYSNNMVEDLHCVYESSVDDIMSSLDNGDVSFFQDTEKKQIFLQYLCVQYFRTETAKRRIENGVGVILKENNIDIEPVWPLLSIIFANNVAFGLASNEESYGIHFIKNESDTLLITGDQPVVNTHWQPEIENLAQDLELYYPLSPRSALLISKRRQFDQGGGMNSGVAKSYNRLILRNSGKHLFGLNKEDLTSIV